MVRLRVRQESVGSLSSPGGSAIRTGRQGLASAVPGLTVPWPNAATMTPTPTDQQIRTRIDSFLAELSGLVRKAAFEAVHEVLGERPARRRRRGPGRPRRSGRPRKAGRRPGRPARGGKRTTEQVDAMAARVLAQVRSKQGQRLEEIGKAMRMPTKGLKLPITKLMAAKKLMTKGQKRGTRYFVR